jgi:hypothetical protein
MARPTPPERALMSLLILNGLRIGEALGANIEALGTERGRRTLTVLRKGGKIVTISPPCAPGQAVDLTRRRARQWSDLLAPRCAAYGSARATADHL